MPSLAPSRPSSPQPFTATAAGRSGPPGDLAIWVFILAELAAFGVLFILYGVARHRHLDLFNACQPTLDRQAGALNTVLLISGSWAAARAVAAIRGDDQRQSARWLLLALGCGAAFLLVKGLEYRAKFAAGIDLDTNLFYMFYLALTGFHFMHVVLGVVILACVWAKTRRGGYCGADHHGMETGVSYWHMVDLVWIILFPLVYVMR